ncbi:MAG: flagellar export protein FliJ [Deltaproteobacteria bacterium]|nr:MAG: flagellar export protein FliJ [Deltaproteobacteria bacterium]
MTRQMMVSKVLELKGFTKEQIEVEVKKTKDKLGVEKSRLDSLEGVFKNTVVEFNSMQGNGSSNIREIELFYDYFSYIGKQIEEQREVVLRQLSELQAKQEAMLEAYKETRLFEILNDKILNKEAKEALLGEQKEIDFNFLSRKSRK